MLGLWNSIFEESLGASGGLGLFWNPRMVSIDLLNISNNWISGSVQSMKSDLKFILINVYGPISNLEKKEVWEDINIFMNNFKDSLF